MIRELGEAIGDTVVESVGRAFARTQEQRPLSADLLESDDAYLAVFDAPGAESEDIQVRFEAGKVLVRVDRFRKFHEGYEMRFPGRGLTLEGSLSIPDDGAVDPGEATATLSEAGTLQIRIPRIETDDEGTDSDESADVEDEADTPASTDVEDEADIPESTDVEDEADDEN
jgi:HSP20 family protein